MEAHLRIGRYYEKGSLSVITLALGIAGIRVLIDTVEHGAATLWLNQDGNRFTDESKPKIQGKAAILSFAAQYCSSDKPGTPAK